MRFQQHWSMAGISQCKTTIEHKTTAHNYWKTQALCNSTHSATSHFCIAPSNGCCLMHTACNSICSRQVLLCWMGAKLKLHTLHTTKQIQSMQSACLSVYISNKAFFIYIYIYVYTYVLMHWQQTQADKYKTVLAKTQASLATAKAFMEPQGPSALHHIQAATQPWILRV